MKKRFIGCLVNGRVQGSKLFNDRYLRLYLGDYMLLQILHKTVKMPKNNLTMRFSIIDLLNMNLTNLGHGYINLTNKKFIGVFLKIYVRSLIPLWLLLRTKTSYLSHSDLLGVFNLVVILCIKRIKNMKLSLDPRPI